MDYWECKEKMKKLTLIILFLIIISLLIFFLSSTFEHKKEKDYLLKELKIGDTYGFVTLKEIKNNSVIINFNYNSVECGPIDRDFELTKDILTVHQHEIALEKIKENSVVIKFLRSYGWC